MDVAANREAQLFEDADIPVDGLAADVEAGCKLLYAQVLSLLEGLQQAEEPNDLASASQCFVPVTFAVTRCSSRRKTGSKCSGDSL